MYDIYKINRNNIINNWSIFRKILTRMIKYMRKKLIYSKCRINNLPIMCPNIWIK